VFSDALRSRERRIEPGVYCQNCSQEGRPAKHTFHTALPIMVPRSGGTDIIPSIKIILSIAVCNFYRVLRRYAQKVYEVPIWSIWSISGTRQIFRTWFGRLCISNVRLALLSYFDLEDDRACRTGQDSFVASSAQIGLWLIRVAAVLIMQATARFAPHNESSVCVCRPASPL
jgi:hypothetical protein